MWESVAFKNPLVFACKSNQQFGNVIKFRTKVNSNLYIPVWYV